MIKFTRLQHTTHNYFPTYYQKGTSGKSSRHPVIISELTPWFCYGRVYPEKSKHQDQQKVWHSVNNVPAIHHHCYWPTQVICASSSKKHH